jgi:hypothetical protein
MERKSPEAATGSLQPFAPSERSGELVTGHNSAIR